MLIGVKMKKEEIKDVVKKSYGKVARKGSCCSCGESDAKIISKNIGYSDEEMNAVPEEVNMGLGCGNPVALSNIKVGDTVLDLGSGAGFDAFLAANKVGKEGYVIGVDMTKEMVDKARENAVKSNYANVEFKLGEIENLPIKDNSIDVVISNCVINLSPDKLKVFKEAYRVLKKGGKMYVSDIVLLEELSEEQRNDKDLVAGCVGGALLKDKYLGLIKKAGFNINILDEDKEISKTQYRGVPLESLKIEAYK